MGVVEEPEAWYVLQLQDFEDVEAVAAEAEDDLGLLARHVRAFAKLQPIPRLAPGAFPELETDEGIPAHARRPGLTRSCPRNQPSR